MIFFLSCVVLSLCNKTFMKCIDTLFFMAVGFCGKKVHIRNMFILIKSRTKPKKEQKKINRRQSILLHYYAKGIERESAWVTVKSMVTYAYGGSVA